LEVVIPARNEERRLPATISATVDHLASQDWSSSIVVVDNGSVDRTAEIIEQFQNPAVKIHLIGCSERGKGAAVRRGILTSSARFIGFIDADNSTPITTLDDAMALLGEGYDAVIASRRAPGARYEVEQSMARRSGSWVFHRLSRLTLPNVSDTQCGFKFFNGPLVREIAGTCRINGFAFDVEMLARIVRAGHTFAEVPIAWADVPGSTFSARRDGFRAMTDLLRIAVSLGA
jgi:glycosyltransferase involved in cell wall biosynthesis